ncbi:hypothetical protein BN2476_450022 [Paraburkholderia piptadeniae]|uniref:Uncharacterized protein n=1 Tax=Paraburkholderia piptadeniae TaxID=1701573 RepID=A0A1N7SC58_9BURK|nr:hypothetical protein BN2476_450022 [Paraburkholderia piptadeniae]
MQLRHTRHAALRRVDRTNGWFACLAGRSGMRARHLGSTCDCYVL